MGISQTTLFFIGLTYLGSMFLIAYIADKGLLPRKLIDHPLVFVLSLGVYAGVWTILGAVGFAQQSGYNFLTFYLGISIAYILAPLLLAPIFKLAKTHELSSLADLIVFRYRSPSMGSFITIIMIIGITPILASQIQAVAASVHFLTQETSKNELAIVFCILITLFTMIFGAQHFSDRNQKHDGLVIAIAVESLLKLCAMGIIAGYCIWTVFDGTDSLNTWLRNNPKNVNLLYQPLIDGNWHSLLLIFFAAAFTMPHMYHMAFSENKSLNSIYVASWGLPIYLLLMALCIPPILFAGIKLFPDQSIPAEMFTLAIGVATQHPGLSILAYLACVSAASGVIIVSTLALASMSLNHLVLPIAKIPTAGIYLYRWLQWQKYLLIAIIMTAAYLVYRVIDHKQTLSQLTLLAFIASVQFLPAVLGVLYWRGANRNGVFFGLLAGFLVWMNAFYLPLVIELDPLGLFGLIGIDFTYNGIQLNSRNWHFITLSSVIINGMVMVGVSLITPTREEERIAAEQCKQDVLTRQKFRHLTIKNAEAFIIELSHALGEDVAFREVSQAMNELGLSPDENRPFALQQLRNRVETNLSRLFGTSHAQELISQYIPYSEASAEEEDFHVLESRLEEYQYRLTGLAAELNNLRKFHRQTLYDLPLGVCALAFDGEIVTWNYALQNITNIAQSEVVGAKLSDLPTPWRNFLSSFVDIPDTHWHRKKLLIKGQVRWLSLHKAMISDKEDKVNGIAILIEDMTDLLHLEAKLTHSERLASIGRLSAGIAHEIGNPVTGIDCLAQNLLYDLKGFQEHPERGSAQERASFYEECQQNMDEIRVQTQRITSIVQSLVNFSHAGKSDRENIAVNIGTVIEETIKLLRLSKAGKELEINVSCDESHRVWGDEQLLIQVFINLISNAIDASQADDKISIRSEEKENAIEISIIDEGEGIPQDILDNIFEPFVTSKDPGKGTGLGLALVRSIIDDHFGSISISNINERAFDKAPNTLEKKETGTKVSIQLPLYSEH